MNTQWTYLLINFCVIIIPFIFSFHRKLRFYQHWKSTILAICITALPFIFWDIYFTKIGVWGFNPDYFIGWKVYNLPIEEILFFICIPYACLFTYHCLKILIPNPFKNYKQINIILVMLSIIVIALNYNHLYPTVTFILLFFAIVVNGWFFKFEWLNNFYYSYCILLLPFFIVNGILTGTGIDKPVVWYNPEEIIGIRLITIPFEDAFYGCLLIMINVALFEFFRQSKNKHELFSIN